MKYDWDEITAHMPATGRRLVEALGLFDALTVLRELAGRDFYVPTTAASKAGQRLAAAVGVQAAGKLIAAFAGRRIYVPKIASVETYLRDKAIFLHIDRPPNEVARKFLICHRTVMRKRRKARESQ